MANDKECTAGSLLQSLPGIYQQDPFVGRFLAAFEKILLGCNDGRRIPPLDLIPGHRHDKALDFEGLEETIAAIATLFIPFVPACEPDKQTGIASHDTCTRDEFLSWLAQWVALTMRADLPKDKQREFIADAMNRYSRRGTRGNLEEMLKIFAVSEPVIEEDATPQPQGGDAVNRQMPPASTHFFRVKVKMENSDPESINRNRDIADSLIKLEKPAHTHYELKMLFTSMQIFDKAREGAARQTAQIGKSTLIGVMPEPQ